MNRMIYVSLLIIFIAMQVRGQCVINGTIRNHDNGEPLSYVNIQIMDTHKGTISNTEGAFRLKIPSLPVKIKVQHIGYDPQILSIDIPPSAPIHIRLHSAPIHLLGVTIDNEDQGVKIMRRAIAKKLRWWGKFRTYRAEAYCRASFANEDGPFLVRENLSEIYWDRKRGTRDVIKSMRQTADTRDAFLPHAGRMPNFYEDEVKVSQFQLISVMHPKALKYYDFKLFAEREVSDHLEYEIEVIPKSRLQPLFQGKIIVTDEYDLISIDLRTADHMLFPKPFDEARYSYLQRFALVDNVMLPVSTVRCAEATVAIPGLRFAPMRMDDFYEIRHYEVNVHLPDSLYDEEEILIDSISVKANPVFSDADPIIVPLTEEEKFAYANTDSTFNMIKAMKPSGFLARFMIKAAEEEEAEELGLVEAKPYLLAPQIWFNRVDGLHLAVENRLRLSKKIMLRATGGYRFGPKRWVYGGALDAGDFSLSYRKWSERIGPTQIYPRLIASAFQLMGTADYWDYYEKTETRLSWQKDIPLLNSTIMLELCDEMHTSLSKTTDYSFFRRRMLRDNPSIEAGRNRALSLKWEYGTQVPLGIGPQKRMMFRAVHSGSALKSDFNYTQLHASIDWRIPTFLRRRFLANCLELRIAGGLSWGVPPIQNWKGLDVALNRFSPFGVLKSVQNCPSLGEDYLGIFWEYNFRTVPFELLGLGSIAKLGCELILHGASARTWIDKDRVDSVPGSWIYQDQFHHEIGVSLNKLFYLFRVDVTRRLDIPVTFVSFGISRFI
ncbi:carboxypeptidase-like regulatory domain-containing protein [bacterium]|nr:carboxypeptidase-like regulatory domain-containing protein [bacterium]